MDTASTSVRDSYVAQFGEAEAAALERAASSHANGINDEDGRGSDPFKWAVLIAIGYQCVELYGKSHGIAVSFDDFKRWAIDYGELETHDGGCDYITLIAGGYDEYVGAGAAG